MPRPILRFTVLMPSCVVAPGPAPAQQGDDTDVTISTQCLQAGQGRGHAGAMQKQPRPA